MESRARQKQDLIFIFGPPFVGKSTIAHAISTKLGYRVMENATLEAFAKNWFDPSDTGYWPFVSIVRQETFAAIAKSYHPGLVVPILWDFSQPGDQEFVEEICGLFKEKLWNIKFVELEASLGNRMRRLSQRSEGNHIEIEVDESYIMNSENYVMNTSGDFPLEYPHLKIITNSKSQDEVLTIILDYFGL